MNNRRKEVFFDMYCKTCKYYKQASYLHPCNDCPRCKVCSDSHCTDAELRAATAVKLDRILSKLVEKENGNEGGCKMGSDCLHYGIGCRSCGNSSSYGEVYHESGEDTFSKPD